jgi:hypothetical protein
MAKTFAALHGWRRWAPQLQAQPANLKEFF